MGKIEQQLPSRKMAKGNIKDKRDKCKLSHKLSQTLTSVDQGFQFIIQDTDVK